MGSCTSRHCATFMGGTCKSKQQQRLVRLETVDLQAEARGG